MPYPNKLLDRGALWQTGTLVHCDPQVLLAIIKLVQDLGLILIFDKCCCTK
jgi:hypothetical protein